MKDLDDIVATLYSVSDKKELEEMGYNFYN